jgi:hypothetical protein
MVVPPRAHAVTCQSVPGSTPGTDISIGGQPHRVPGVSNVKVCVDTGSIGLISVSFAGNGYCDVGCFSVLIPGGGIDLAGVTISYALDGSPRSTTVDPGGTPGGEGGCLLSVGGPEAPYPTCSPGVAIGPDIDDETVEETQDDVNDLVAGLEQTACDAFPPMVEHYENGTRWVTFCEDPVRWANAALSQFT